MHLLQGKQTRCSLHTCCVLTYFYAGVVPDGFRFTHNLSHWFMGAKDSMTNNNCLLQMQCIDYYIYLCSCEYRDLFWAVVFWFCCRESVESLIHKHSYARSPIRTYAGDEEPLGEDGHSTHSRGKTILNSIHFVALVFADLIKVSFRRFRIHSFGQPLPELLGHHHIWFFGVSAPSITVRHRNRRGILGQFTSSPHPGLSTPLQSTGNASYPLRPGKLHAGQRAYLPLFPHATVPPLLPARALRRHPRTASFLHSHDSIRMITIGHADKISLLLACEDTRHPNTHAYTNASSPTIFMRKKPRCK